MPAYRIIEGPELGADGRTVRVVAHIWHDAASRDAGDPPFIKDDFLFSRGAATGQTIVRDPADGWPLLDDDSRAPAHTGQSIRDLVIARDPSLLTTEALVSMSSAVASAVPVNPEIQSANDAVQAAWSALRQVVIDKFRGEPYEPAGQSFKRVTAPTLTPAAVRRALKKRYEREKDFRAAAQGLASDPDIAALSGEEGDL
ncbi:MAG: hypothetical protein DWQ20_00955 [Actinobacteria bacterium]|nr:MAG: hypothetical protein DWQ20_00955 [Actinomycetota bacterium]